MFEGLSLDSPAAAPAAEAAGNIFSGLNLGGSAALPTPPQTVSLPAASEAPNGDTPKGITRCAVLLSRLAHATTAYGNDPCTHSHAHSLCSCFTCSNPLPEDLFSSLDDLTLSSAPASDPFPAAGADPFASPPQKQASKVQRAAESNQPNELAPALPPRSAPSGASELLSFLLPQKWCLLDQFTLQHPVSMPSQTWTA